MKAMTCIDLTTLSGDDTPGRVRRLCAKARRPLSDELIEALDLAEIGLTVAAVCVYPIMVGPAVKVLEGSGFRLPPSLSAFPPAYLALPLDEFGGFVSSARKPFRTRRSYREPETDSNVV